MTRRRKRRPISEPPSPERVFRALLGVVGGAVLTLIPLAPGLELPLQTPEGGDLAIRVSALVGCALGAGVYWSFPRRAGARRRTRARVRAAATFTSALASGLLLAFGTMFLDDGTLLGSVVLDSSIYGLWCAAVVTLSAMIIRDPGRRSTRPRRSSGGEIEMSIPARPIEPATSPRKGRECPWCGERIPLAAQTCDFCGHDVGRTISARDERAPG